jgi:hypothetical protein
MNTPDNWCLNKKRVCGDFGMDANVQSNGLRKKGAHYYAVNFLFIVYNSTVTVIYPSLGSGLFCYYFIPPLFFKARWLCSY